MPTWAQFERPEQFHELLATVGNERRKLREAELRLKVEAEAMVVRAIQLGVPREKVAELTGYSSGTLEKWEGSAASRRTHEIKQQLRDEARARAREARRKAQNQTKQSPVRRKRK